MKTYRVYNLFNGMVWIIKAHSKNDARKQAFDWFFNDGSNKAKPMAISIKRINAGVT